MNTETLQRAELAESPPATDPSPPAANPAPAEDIRGATAEQLKQVVGDLKESGGEALQSAKAAGSDFVHEQQEMIAAKIDCYTQAVNAACDSLRGGEGNLLVSPAQRASRQLERASDYLRNKNATDFLEDLGDLARRKPELFYGGLFVAGLAAVRFLKASSRDRRSSQSNGGNGSRGILYPSSAPNSEAGSAPGFNRQSGLNPATLK